MPVRLDPLAPSDAIAALIARGQRLHPTFAWQEVYAEIHASMFTVAKSSGHDVLQTIFDQLLRALENGETFESFSKRLRPMLIDAGWWGHGTSEDPLEGATFPARLGSMRRLRTIFDVNMRVSYAVGHWRQFERVREFRPFLRYVAVIDDVTRDQHRALHNLVLPIDHPFWATFAAPNGWNCRCTMQSLSQSDIDQLLAAGVPLFFEPPVIGTRSWLNKRTGETRDIPIGIDPGWDYNPGAAGHAHIEADLKTKASQPIA